MSDPVYAPNSHKYREEQKQAAANTTEEKRVTKHDVKSYEIEPWVMERLGL